MLVRHSRKKFNYLSFGKAAGKQKTHILHMSFVLVGKNGKFWVNCADLVFTTYPRLFTNWVRKVVERVKSGISKKKRLISPPHLNRFDLIKIIQSPIHKLYQPETKYSNSKQLRCQLNSTCRLLSPQNLLLIIFLTKPLLT